MKMESADISLARTITLQNVSRNMPMDVPIKGLQINKIVALSVIRPTPIQNCYLPGDVSHKHPRCSQITTLPQIQFYAL